MNVTGAHVAGGGLGAILAVALAAAGKKIGLDLTPTEATGLGLDLFGIGIGAGHFCATVIGKAWRGPGVFPAIRRGLFGAKVKS